VTTDAAVTRPRDETVTGTSIITVSTAPDRDRLLSLRGEWTDLLLDSQQPSAFLSWEWMHTWLQTYAARGRPHVLLARQGPAGRLVGLAPLYEASSRILRPRVMNPMGTGVGADHLGFIARRGAGDEVGAALADAVLSLDTWEVLDFPRLDEQTAQRLLSGASARGAGRLVCTSTVADLCPYVPLPPTWDAYLGTLSSNARKDLGRRWRRLRERGQVTIERLVDVSDLDRGWDVLLRLHQDRRQAVGGRSAFTANRVGVFHKTFMRAAAERGWLRLYLMRVDDHYVAAEYCLNVGRRVSDVQTGSDAEWARYGVGTLIVAHAMQEAIAEGAREYDLLRGGEYYKQQRWGASVRQDVSLLVWRRRPRVLMLMAARGWETTVKSFVRQRLNRRRVSA